MTGRSVVSSLGMVRVHITLPDGTPLPPDKATRVAISIIAAIREHGPSREVIAARIREAYGE